MDIHWNKEWTVPSVVGVVSLGVGAAIGYGICWRQTKNARQVLENIREALFEIEEEVEDEVPQLGLLDLPENWMDGFKERTLEDANLKLPSASISQVVEEQKIGPLVIPAETYEQVANVQIDDEEDEDLITITVTEEGTEIVIGEPNSIWDNETDGWDYDEEIAKRTADAPYIIHKDEFDAEESGYSQSTLTFYVGDQVLVDEKDVPLYDAGKIIGEPVFGHGSLDPSICYIRNDRLEAEYEILLEEGHYQVEVLGAEIEHSYDSRKEPLRRFRD